MKSPEQQYNDDVRTELEGKTFPNDYIHPVFRQWLIACLPHVNHIALKCEWEIFRTILTTDLSKFMLYEMSFAINAVVTRKRQELNYSVQSFVEMMDAVGAMSAHWHTLVDPIKTSVSRRISTMAKLSGGNGRQIPIGKA